MPKIVPLPSSTVTGIVWPPVPALPQAMTEVLLGQLQKSQWWPAERLLHWQLRQLTEVASFAAQTVPFYRDRLKAFAAPQQAITLEEWRAVPLLSRTDVRRKSHDLVTAKQIKAHGSVTEPSTSGSTGEPVMVKMNAVTRHMGQVIATRDYLAKDFDPAGKFAVIKRAASAELAAEAKRSKEPWLAGRPGAPMVMQDIGIDVGAALDWLARERPAYLMTYPSYLRAMLVEAMRRKWQPNGLRQIVVFSEAVDDDLADLCLGTWGVPVRAHYSAQEVGPIAFEHPDGGDYLVQAEAVFLEVLRDDGMPCEVGEVGKVVLTPLHNFTMPLIRYDIGDYAEVGPPSPCGRGLPTLRRILGRATNMLALPQGGRRYVAMGGSQFVTIDPLRQLQLVQKTLDEVVLKAVVDRPLTPDEEIRLKTHIDELVGDEFQVRIQYVDQIPRTAGGKYMDVISELPDDQG